VEFDEIDTLSLIATATRVSTDDDDDVTTSGDAGRTSLLLFWLSLV
jgi:hypothetical protein